MVDYSGGGGRVMKETSGHAGGGGARKQGAAAASPCAACKLLRRRCSRDCVFAPYFPAEEPHKFASVHKVFGASNVNKMLQELEEHQRGDAVSSMVYEANARVRDPVYGCVGAISSLQRQVDALQTQLALAQAEVVQMRMRMRMSPTHHHHLPPATTTTNNNTSSSSPSGGGTSRHHHHQHHSSSSNSRSLFSMDDMMVDDPNVPDSSLWSC